MIVRPALKQNYIFVIYLPYTALYTCGYPLAIDALSIILLLPALPIFILLYPVRSLYRGSGNRETEETPEPLGPLKKYLEGLTV